MSKFKEWVSRQTDQHMIEWEQQWWEIDMADSEFVIFLMSVMWAVRPEMTALGWLLPPCFFLGWLASLKLKELKLKRYDIMGVPEMKEIAWVMPSGTMRFVQGSFVLFAVSHLFMQEAYFAWPAFGLGVLAAASSFGSYYYRSKVSCDI